MVPTEFEPAREKENVNPFREFYLDFLVTETEADRVAVLKQVIGKLEELIKTRGHLTEYEERYVNHVRRSIRNLDKKDKTEEILELNKKILEFERQGKENELSEGKEAEFDDIFAGLNEKQILTILKEMNSLQLSKGCTNACGRCSACALRGVRKNISWAALLDIVKHIQKLDPQQSINVRVKSYEASDPADYQTKDGRTIVDVEKLFSRYTNIRLSHMSKIPSGRESVMRELSDIGADLGISYLEGAERFESMAKRVRAWPNYGRTTDIGHSGEKVLREPIGMHYDGKIICRSLDSGISTVVSPEGCFSEIATSVNPIYPDGRASLPINKSVDKIFKRKFLIFGRDRSQEIDYFLPLEMVDAESGKEEHFSGMTEPQVVESILSEGLLPIVYGEKPDKKERKLAGTSESADVKSFINGRENSKDVSSDFRLSYLLASIKEYLLSHKREHKILKKTKNDNQPYKFAEASKVISQLPDEFKDKALVEAMGGWDKYQVFVYWLLQDPNNKVVDEFIKSHPAKFDPEAVKIVPDGEVEVEKKKEISLERMIEWFNFDLSLIRSLPAYVANQYENKGFVRMAVGAMLDRFEKISDVKLDDLSELKRISQLKRVDDNGTDEYGYRYVLAIMREYESRRLKSKE